MTAYSQDQMCTREGNRHILTPIFLSSSSHTISTQASGKFFILLDGHRTHCSFPVVLQTAVHTLVRLPRYCTDALQPLDKCFFCL